jgi:hypothetical protein
MGNFLFNGEGERRDTQRLQERAVPGLSFGQDRSRILTARGLTSFLCHAARTFQGGAEFGEDFPRLRQGTPVRASFLARNQGVMQVTLEESVLLRFLRDGRFEFRDGARGDFAGPGH